MPRGSRGDPTLRPVPEGLTLLMAPDGVVAASHAGVAYPVEDGLVLVPLAAVAALAEHGFRPAE